MHLPEGMPQRLQLKSSFFHVCGTSEKSKGLPHCREPPEAYILHMWIETIEKKKKFHRRIPD